MVPYHIFRRFQVGRPNLILSYEDKLESKSILGALSTYLVSMRYLGLRDASHRGGDESGQLNSNLDQ